MQLDPLLTQEQITARTAALAALVSARWSGKRLVVLAVATGGVPFAVDLVRHLQGVDVELDLLGVSSYVGTESTGQLVHSFGPRVLLEGADVLVVDDILDTGRTLQFVVDLVREAGASSVTTMVLLDKPERRVVPIEADHVGFVIADQFVVGHGLDYDGRFRHLHGIHVVTRRGSHG
jgi:hypoxanthine phosphoribosyltransferase